MATDLLSAGTLALQSVHIIYEHRKPATGSLHVELAVTSGEKMHANSLTTRHERPAGPRVDAARGAHGPSSETCREIVTRLRAPPRFAASGEPNPRGHIAQRRSCLLW